MANNNHPESTGNDWVDEVLSKPDTGSELGPDEHAVNSAGLTDISDAEVERIMQETMAEDWDSASAEEKPQEEPEVFHDEEYRDTFGEGEELEAAFSDKPAPSEKKHSAKPAETAPVRKGRPKRRKGYGLLGIPHLLATAVWLIIIVAIGVSIGRIVWLSAADVLAFGREDQKITITIEETDDIESISDKLQKAGLIRYPKLFKVYADLTHAEEDIDPGTYELNTLYDYHALVNSMQIYSSARAVVEVMIPEGYSCAQTFALLEEKGVCTVEALEAYAANGELDDYWFLETVERGDRYCLEGFLFPDTYEFYIDDDPERVLEKMLDDFDYRFTDTMLENLDLLNQRLAQIMANNGHDETYIAEHQITIHDLVIVASLIEKETANTLESYTISSVIYNRLYNWGSTPAYLNIDATVIYALGGNLDPETGKTKALTYEDLEIDHPYNTYKYLGLPPGAIANPGLNSLYAALDPDESDYYFYVLDPETGEHHFSETESEHNAFLSSLEDSE